MMIIKIITDNRLKRSKCTGAWFQLFLSAGDNHLAISFDRHDDDDDHDGDHDDDRDGDNHSPISYDCHVDHHHDDGDDDDDDDHHHHVIFANSAWLSGRRLEGVSR